MMLLGKENINFTNSDLAKMMKSINKIYILKQSRVLYSVIKKLVE